MSDKNRKADRQPNREIYLADPTKCPYCFSYDIQIGDTHEDTTEDYEEALRTGTRMDLVMKCGKCGNHWHDYYEAKLAGVGFAGIDCAC